jgi:hypothetical protein
LIPTADEQITFCSLGRIHHVRIDVTWRDHPNRWAHTAEGFIVEAEDEGIWWERGWTDGVSLLAALMLSRSGGG